MIRAVIFDMDGLLVDSERVALGVMHESGLRHGVDLKEEEIRCTIGSNYASCCAFYRSIYPHLDVEAMFVTFAQIMKETALTTGIPLKKGARTLLDTLESKRIPCAVASSSPYHLVETYLRKLDVFHYFRAFATGTDELPSKPEPDIFLLAAERLGVSPENCLVLEDSVNGIRAGRAAGMTVCMIPDLTPFSEALAPYCDAVRDDLAAVIPLLKA